MNIRHITLTAVILSLTAHIAVAETNNREKIIKDQAGSKSWEAVLERHTDFKTLDRLNIDPVERDKTRSKELHEPVFGTREYYRMEAEKLKKYKPKEDKKKADK